MVRTFCLAIGLTLLLLVLPSAAHGQELEQIVVHLSGPMDHPCGHECNEERRGQGNGAEDSVRSSKELMRYEILLEELSDRLGVEYSSLVALGLQESDFFPLAVGPGGECGVFQQTPRYAHPRVLRGTMTDTEYCALLENPDWAVKALSSKLQTLGLSRLGSSWPIEYNGGEHANRLYPQCVSDPGSIGPGDRPGYMCRHAAWRSRVENFIYLSARSE